MVSVKVFFDNEIRRFQFDAPKSGPIFASLVHKLITMLPKINLQEMHLCWKDCEGDVIIFSTDDELKEALRNQEDGILKIYITLKSQQTQQQRKELINAAEQAASKESYNESFAPNLLGGNKSGGKHPLAAKLSQTGDGKMCNNCKAPLQGTKHYNCCWCTTPYYLCAKCEQSNVHSHHRMLRITAEEIKPHRHVASRGVCRAPRTKGLADRMAALNHGDLRPARGRVNNRVAIPSCNVFGNPPDFWRRAKQCDFLSQPHGAYSFAPNNYGTIHDDAQPQNEQLDERIRLEHELASSPESDHGLTSQEIQQHIINQQTTVDNLLEGSQLSWNSEGSDNVLVGYTTTQEYVPTFQEMSEQDQGYDKPPSCRANEDAICDPELSVIAAATMQSQNAALQSDVQHGHAPDTDIDALASPEESVNEWTFVQSTDENSCSEISWTEQIDSKVAAALAQMLNMGFTNDNGWLQQMLAAKEGDIDAVLESVHSQLPQ